MVIYISSIVNASIFGNMAVLIQTLDQSTQKYKEIMDIVNEHMRYLKVPNQLQTKIRNYHEYMNVRQKNIFLDINLFEDLSQGLKKQVLLSQYRHFLIKMNIFDNCTPGFLEELVLHLKPSICLPNYNVIVEGEIGNEMYFISKGIC